MTQTKAKAPYADRIARMEDELTALKRVSALEVRRANDQREIDEIEAMYPHLFQSEDDRVHKDDADGESPFGDERD